MRPSCSAQRKHCCHEAVRGLACWPMVRSFGMLTLSLIAGTQSSPAESRLQVLGGTPRSCQTQVERVRATLNRLPVPDEWTFVIACSPNAWEALLRRADALGKTNTAFTNLEAHYTFFNGWNFSARVAAHEIGHIVGQTEDHERAEEIGMRLLRRARRSLGKRSQVRNHLRLAIPGTGGGRYPVASAWTAAWSGAGPGEQRRRLDR